MDRYNGTLEEAGISVPQKPKMFTLCDSVDKEVRYICGFTPMSLPFFIYTMFLYLKGFLLQEKGLTKRFAEAKSENFQRQKQMDLAKNFLSQVRKS